jgi:hypothetical protein
MKYKIGDKVVLRANAPLYKSSSALISTSKLKSQKITNITRIASGSKHPYNTTGDLGWINESDISLYEVAPVDDKTKYEMEIELIDINGLFDYLKENKNKVLIMKSDDLERVINNEGE